MMRFFLRLVRYDIQEQRDQSRAFDLFVNGDFIARLKHRFGMDAELCGIPLPQSYLDLDEINFEVHELNPDYIPHKNNNDNTREFDKPHHPNHMTANLFVRRTLRS